MRVLIADDNLDLARSLATVLQTRGATTVVVPDGSQALEAANNQRFDAAVVDLKMPNRSGLEVLQAMRAAGQPQCLIAVTGYDSAERIRAVERLGQVPVLRKPFDPQELLNILGLHGGEQPELPRRARLAVLGDGSAELGPLPGVLMDRFADADMIREAVADHQYDAAILLLDDNDEAEEISADLRTLDQDLAVIRSARPGLVADAVERSRCRREAADRLEMLQSLMRNAPAPLLVLGGDPCMITDWSANLETLLGHRGAELHDSGLDRIEDPAHPRQIAKLVEQVRLGGQPVSEDLRIRCRGGAIRQFAVLATPADSGEQAVMLSFGAVGPLDPHTEALRMLGATAAGVAHEMRNTLAGVGNSLTVLQHRIPKDSAAAEVLLRIRERTARAQEVMSDLLAFARPVNMRFKTVPARMVLLSAADRVREGAPSGIQVHVRVPDPTLRIQVDPVALQMALVDLGNNAVQALPGNGNIELSCVRETDGVQLRVTDDGPGIPDSLRQEIFDPFFTTRARGSGLGLANVRKVVEAHGGTVRLEDSPRGARFLIGLPPRPGYAEED